MKKTITTNEFFDIYEETNLKAALFIADKFITNMKASNPYIKHFTDSDWISVLLNDYLVEYDEEMGINGELKFISII